jgi:hypothetical protein
MAVVPDVVTNTSPAKSTATPVGELIPEATVDWQEALAQPAATSTTLPLLWSAMKTSPAPSTATPVGPLRPLPTVVWQLELTQPAGTSTTRL